MLAIRMQRTGRSGHAQFRLIVQDSRFHPTRGRVVAYLGSYDPHTKKVSVDKEVAQKYLDNGAQPSDRVAKILKDEGVKLPVWYKPAAPKKRSIRNPDKLRRNRPAEAVSEASEKEAPAAAEVATEAPVAEEASSEAPSDEETPKEQVEQAAPAEPSAEEPKAEEDALEAEPAEPAAEAPAAEETSDQTA